MKKTKKLIENTSIRNMIFLGIIIILFSIIISELTFHIPYIKNPEPFKVVKKIIIQLFTGIGSTLIISAIFSWIIGTESFLEFIDDKILKKMSSPEYVENLSPEAKRKLLKEVIKPNIEVSKIYSPTSSYFEGQIKKSMDMFKCAFRSDLNIHGKAKFNTEKNRVETKATITYKTYKFEGSHEDLQIGIEGESADLGDATVFLQSGTSKNLVFQLVDKDNPKVSEKFKNEESIKKVAVCELPEELSDQDSFLIKREITEFGEDHWHHYSYRASMPIHGLNLTIDCEKGLLIKDVIPYGSSGIFDIKTNEKRDRLTIICSNWIETGFGLSIIIGKEDIV